MTNHTSDTPQHSSDWNTYWQGTGEASAFTSGGANHPAIGIFWEEFFNSTKQNFINPKIIDIASGNGAVIETVLTVYGDQKSEISSLDISPAAIENIHSRFPTVNCIVSDARSIPLDTGSFNIVTSQFGIEYAGQDSILEAARLVDEGGLLALLLHSESGSIHQECQQSLDAIERVQASRFVPLATEMFDAGFKAVTGADRKPYEQAAKKLAPAISELESIMKQYGQHVAGDTISRLYNDVGQIHQRIQHYQPEDILKWLSKMDEELTAYTGRMSSMCKAAISSLNFEQIQTNLQELGFSIEKADTLSTAEHDLPMAWILIAKK